MSRMIRVNVAAAAFAAMLFAASSGHAAITWNLQPAGTGAWDWTLSGENWIYPDYADPDPVTGIASAFWSGIAWGPAAGHCIELATLPGSGTQNPDTRIWVEQSNTGVWQSVNDDFGGTLQSKARLWVSMTSTIGSLEYYLKIAPYAASENTQDFAFTETRRDLSQAACTTGQTTIPWVSIVGNGSTFTFTLSPNAT
jgi:hypothetical protein